MKQNTEQASPDRSEEPSPRGGASRLLLGAALTGLLGLTTTIACGSDDSGPGDSSGSGGASSDHDHDHDDAGAGASGSGGASSGGASSGGASSGGASSETDAGSGGTASDDGGAADDTFNNLIDPNANYTRAEFDALCAERDGYSYVNAACAGGSLCRGLSLHNGQLWDHSCRGQNSTCAGIGCLVMGKDTGLTGAEIYKNGPCVNCHADWSSGEADTSRYALFYYPKTITAEAATQRFKESSLERLVASVAIGVSGIHPDGTPFNNMPAYYQKYSLREIKAVAEYVKGLTVFLYPYEVFGDSPPGDGGTGMGPAPDGG